MYKQLSMAVTLCTLAGGISTAQAQVMCGDTITTSEVLTSDLLCTMDDPALTIQGPSGRLNMNNFTVSCGGSDADGIRLTGTGALLQNGTVSDCLEGVELDGSNHRLLNEMLVENNGRTGVDIDSGSGHQIRQTTSRNNGEDGFGSAGGSEFDRNRATGNATEGFQTEGGDTLTRNTSSGNGDEGFAINGGNNLVTQNVAQGNGTDGDEGDGFDVDSDGNRLTRNSARNNFGDGIDVRGGLSIAGGSNDDDANAAQSATSQSPGLIQPQGVNNTLTDNLASGNGSADPEGDGGGFDLEDDNPDCDANVWTNNRGTRNQPCIQ